MLQLSGTRWNTFYSSQLLSNSCHYQELRGFKVLLFDQLLYSIFQQHKFNVDGDKLESTIDTSEIIEYKIKIFEEIHLDDDPHYPCKEYDYPGQYDQCLGNSHCSEN